MNVCTHPFTPPEPDCRLCPRLAAFRDANRSQYPSFYNGAVPPFGAIDASLLVIGLAPGLKGANQTGRPFTGDFAGDILYGALKKIGRTSGEFKKRADDGFALIDTRVTNAVRCVPQQNKPLPEEVKTCNGFLTREIAAMPKLETILCLGRVSHEATLRALGKKLKDYTFGHGNCHRIETGGRILNVWNSYHTSRYNIQTRRLTDAMFDELLLRCTQR